MKKKKSEIEKYEKKLRDFELFKIECEQLLLKEPKSIEHSLDLHFVKSQIKKYKMRIHCIKNSYYNVEK